MGICRMDLILPGNDNLKGKRRLSKSIMERMKQRYNVSVAEVDCQDNWQRLVLGVACVSNEGGHVREILNDLVRWVESSFDVNMVDCNIDTV